MIQLKILVEDDPGLRGSSEPVKEVTEELKQFALEMMTTMAYNGGIGLSAPQVGKKIQVIVLDTTFSEDNGKIAIMFNPKILHKEGEVEIAEGCLSFPGRQVKVKRARNIRVEYTNTKNERGYVDLTGLAAIVAQHEIEHLQGTLIIDYERH